MAWLLPDYCVKFWSPHLKKDTAEWEKVQKVTIQMIKPLKHIHYEAEIKRVGLLNVEQRQEETEQR